MTGETRELIISLIRAEVTDESDLMDLLISMEPVFDVRFAMLSRGEVENEFEEAWEAEGEHRKMTDAEWAKFASQHLWATGHVDVFREGLWEAIRWDLREANLLPEGAVIE